MRSDDAIAACSRLNFSDMSLIGRKKRCAYCRKATSAPSVSVPVPTQPPPATMISAAASAATSFDRRVEHRVVEDRLDVGVAVAAVDRRRSARSSRASRRNSCTVAMPVRFSCRKALMRATQPADACGTTRGRGGGTTASPARSAAAPRRRPAPAASPSTARTPMMPTSMNTSPNTATTPAENRSFRASTSLVTRVIRRPTGLRS